MKRDAFTLAPDDVREIRHFHLFCGLGGGAKGFSGLLNETRSKTEKYQALNCLTGHGATARNFNTWECRWMYPPAAQKPEGGE